ncbi:MAG TPA: rod shape-determining protein MreC, partial [Rhodocyclaceae bacterium]|nr:rod shape-determining protein MreC [Rhodocyclaceae bacterium]
DVESGDLLVTSGLDGIYLPGYPVAKVVSIQRENSYSFARIHCAPVAGVENFGEVLVLAPRQPLPPPPADDPSRNAAPPPPKKVRAR